MPCFRLSQCHSLAELRGSREALMLVMILLGLVILWCAVSSHSASASEGQEQPKDSKVRNIGSRLELLVDDWLIEKMD